MNIISLAGKVALVTGGSQGIGFHSANAIARAGASVAIVARRRDILNQACQKLRETVASKILAVEGDVADFKFPPKAIEEVRQNLGPIDILVNNAGGPPPGAFMEVEPGQWQTAIAQNLMSVVHFSRLVIPQMREKKWGRIINIASTSAKEPLAGMVLSNAIRAAVAATGKTMSNEFSRYGITVNTVCPGPTYTARANSLIQARIEKESISEENVISQIVANVPMGRMAQPEEIGSVVCFLASDAASYVTGVTFPVDGGAIRSL